MAGYGKHAYVRGEEGPRGYFGCAWQDVANEGPRCGYPADEYNVHLRPEETETFGIRCNGGGLDGQTLFVKPGTDLHSWPLADRFAFAGGEYEYVKVRESQLTEPMPGVLRGAEYEWREVAPSNLGGTDG